MQIPRDVPYTGMLRDLMMNLLGAVCYYFGRDFYYQHVLHINNTTTLIDDTDVHFNNLWWVAFVPLFCSRFPQQRGLGVDMMLKGWIGASLAIVWLFITVAISPTNFFWILVAIFLDGFVTHLFHVHDRTFLAFNVFHLMLYWGAIMNAYQHHISIRRNTTTDTDTNTNRVDWEYTTVLAYSYFIPYSIGIVIALGCHLLFCPISSTMMLKETLTTTGMDMASILRTFSSSLTKNRTLETGLETTIKELHHGGTTLLRTRTKHYTLVAHAYLETRWIFRNHGYVLEQRAANQARVMMTMNALCTDVAYRLQQLVNDNNDNLKRPFQVPEEVNEFIHDTEAFMDKYSKIHMAHPSSHLTTTTATTTDKNNTDTMSMREEGERIIKKLNTILNLYTTKEYSFTSPSTSTSTTNSTSVSSSTSASATIIDRLFVTILYSLRNVILSLITNDTLFIINNNDTRSTGRVGGDGGSSIWEDWKRQYHRVDHMKKEIFSWHSHTFRTSIQQSAGLVILTILLYYIYGVNVKSTSCAFAINTYCSVLRQVFCGWALCRILVRCGGFFLGWLVAGIVYVIAAYGFGNNNDNDDEITTTSPPVSILFFIVHMLLCVLMTSQKFRWFEALCGKERIHDTGEGDPHMYVSYSMVVAWIVISNGWYGNETQPITMYELTTSTTTAGGVDNTVWTDLFLSLVVPASLASAVAICILSFLFPSFATHYLRQRLGMMTDIYQTWFNITTVVDGKHKLTKLHHTVLHDIAHESDLLFLKIQRNTTKSLQVELWFQRVWKLFVTGQFLDAKCRNRTLDYKETAVAHLQALEHARRMWISLWELSPEIGPQGKHFGLSDRHYHPFSAINNDYISAIAQLGKAYYGAPYSNVYRFALPARLPNSLVQDSVGGGGGDSRGSYSHIAPESFTLEGIVLEGSTTRLGNALYDWMHLVNELYGFPGLTWPCLYPAQKDKTSSKDV